MRPRTLSHYEIRDELSRGGMGIVYRAFDVKLEREVALKIVRPDLVKNEGRKRRFVQEAKAAAALKHPNIAVIYGIEEREPRSVGDAREWRPGEADQSNSGSRVWVPCGLGTGPPSWTG